MKRKIISILFALVLVLLLSGTPVYASDSRHFVYGYVTIDGEPAPVGTVISGKGDGVTYPSLENPITLTVAGSYGYSGTKALHVKGAEGSIIHLYVNGIETGVTCLFGSNWGYTKADDLNISSFIPGDVNGDRVLNATDIIEIELIVAGAAGHPETPGADANEDEVVNAIDITKTELLVAT